MQDIKTFVKRLRQAANVLEELFIGNGTPAIARKIIEGGTPKKLGRPPNPQPRGGKKGYSYKGLHWTQRPENRRKLAAMAARSASTRLSKQRAGLKVVANG